MKFNIKGITIIVEEDYSSMSRKSAEIVSYQIANKPNSVLGLATGSTPKGLYKELIQLYKNNKVNFKEITSFNLDEYYPISKDNKNSYAYYMDNHLFKHVNIDKNKAFIPNGETDNVDKMCKNYDQMIYDTGGIDLQILGIGNNGHIGFNEPDVDFELTTHLVKLDDKTIEANARFFDNIDNVPKSAVSMGIQNIMQSKKIILMASGEGKAKIIHDMIFGKITPKLPASILQLHNNVTILLDSKAAKIII